jgi:hypothetical protein
MKLWYDEKARKSDGGRTGRTFGLGPAQEEARAHDEIRIAAL